MQDPLAPNNGGTRKETGTGSAGLFASGESRSATEDSACVGAGLAPARLLLSRAVTFSAYY